MATPFVPVAVPVGRSLPGGGGGPRADRTPSLGSISNSSGSSSSKGPGDEGAGPRGGEGVACRTPPHQCQSPMTRARLNGADCSMEYSSCPRYLGDGGGDGGHGNDEDLPGCDWEGRPLTPTVLGYEVMEERAKFTVYKILVKKTQEESWVVFRRYTDFSRMNDKLKEMFPGFRLSLPPKRWFKDNYDSDFLEDRQLGLQVFLQNMVAHKDIANCVAVREFLCLDDPPGPFDSLEESRAFCETLEECNYRLQKELCEKQKEIASLKRQLEEKQLHIQVLEKRLSGAALTGPGSESSVEADADGDVESSAAEADQEMGEESSSGETPSSRHSCWCGPPLGSSPPVMQVSESLLEP
ncbi:sorting nexin-16 isoform X1 [Anguilla anguilla]|uniref:sorting nexin-16 isoform X1 n=1 Tax=Anguilla anguilla TaxID=7936 RepID=UPI0015B30637|nr:sorting nexin-16 isoform X1 [Anguilla anguilla]